MLNPDLIADRQRVRENLRQPFAVFENALIPEVAEQLHAELSQLDNWQYQDNASFSEEQIRYSERHAPGYTFSRHTLQFGTDDLPPRLQAFREYLVTDSIRDWMADVSGRRCDDFEGGAALLKEGGHIADHNDYGIFRLDDGTTVTRSVTFNYYLTRDWDPDWGGNFVWNKPHTVITPGFNTLVMFLVGQNSSHHVEPVLPSATGSRIAITGWYRTHRRGEHSIKL